MLKGVHLTLMVGPAVPRPAPRAIIDALVSAVVTNDVDGPSGFQLTFALSNRSLLQTTFLLAAAAVVPVMRVVLVATINGKPEVLIDGVMTDHQVTPGEDGRSQLVVTGDDLTRLMDRQELSGLPYPATSSAARVALILAKYLAFGIVPIVIPPFLSDAESPVERVAHHQGTDLGYVQALARTVGYTFYIEPGERPLTNRAYWGPDFKLGAVQPALNINLDAHTNCESLRFRIDNEAAVQPYVVIHEPTTKLPIPIPIPTNLSIINPALGAVPVPPKAFVQVQGTSHLSFTRALLRGLAVAAQTSDTVHGDGRLDVARYGHILRVRRLVAVRGAGAAFDGLYYVRKVTHQIRKGQFAQDFSLSRSGLVSTISKVSA
jgi:hypothetical protein